MRSADSTIRILVVDHHAIMRAGLRMILEASQDMEMVGEAEDGDEAVEQARRLRPHIALMDIEMPTCDGLTATGELADHCPEVRTIMLTRRSEFVFLSEAFRLGARGYALKDRKAEELLEAIRKVHRGGVYIDPTLQRDFNDLIMSRGGEPVVPAPILSEREREVAGLIAQGYTNRETAEILGVSPGSVGTYRLRIMQKLGLRSRAELVRYAMRTGVWKLDQN